MNSRVWEVSFREAGSSRSWRLWHRYPADKMSWREAEAKARRVLEDLLPGVELEVWIRSRVQSHAEDGK